MQDTGNVEQRTACEDGTHDLESEAREWLVRGCDQERIQDWPGAVVAYNHALAAEPVDPRVRYFANNNLGYSLLQLGRFDEAEEYCEAAILINPGQYNAHKNLGLALEGQGRWLDAAQSLVEAARLCPQDARAWLHLQQLLTLKPDLLAQSPDLTMTVASLETGYRSAGSIPKLN
jgi:tetratricopeptide (TPR) repeat protein